MLPSGPGKRKAASTLLALAALSLTAGASVARAQAPTSIATLRVSVIGTDSQPIVGAIIEIFDSKNRPYAAARSDSVGSYSFRLAFDGPHNAVVAARAVGYAPETQTISTTPTSDLAIVLHLVAIPAGMRPVVSVARRDTYMITDRDIGASHRTIDNAMDAIKALSPSMQGDIARNCPPVKNLWVNGRRIWTYTRPLAAPDRSSGIVYLQKTGPSLKEELSLISASGIASIQYVNCWDWSDPRIGTNDALFIILKPGVRLDSAPHS